MVDANVGKSFQGRVKSYSPSKGYGFVVSEEFDSDLFFWHRNLSKDTVDAILYDDFYIKDKEIMFTFEVSAEGKPTATAISLIGGEPRRKGKGGFKGSSKGNWGGDFYESMGGYGGKSSKGYSKGDRERAPRRDRSRDRNLEPGTPLIDNIRITGTMKSYSSENKWGFAVADPIAGDFGDVFVHMNNASESLVESKNSLREGDLVEMRLEEVSGRTVAKDVSLVPQDAHMYENQWMRGIVRSFNELGGDGLITSSRVLGDVWFVKHDAPDTFGSHSIDQHVLYKLVIGSDGNPSAKFVNPMEELEPSLARERAQEVVDDLHANNFIDDTAKTSLQQTKFPTDIFGVLPNLEFYKADNPSSFILGALTRVRKSREEGGGRKGSDRGANKWDMDYDNSNYGRWKGSDYGYSKGGKGDYGYGKGGKSYDDYGYGKGGKSYDDYGYGKGGKGYGDYGYGKGGKGGYEEYGYGKGARYAPY